MPYSKSVSARIILCMQHANINNNTIAHKLSQFYHAHKTHMQLVVEDADRELPSTTESAVRRAIVGSQYNNALALSSLVLSIYTEYHPMFSESGPLPEVWGTYLGTSIISFIMFMIIM